MLAEDGLNFFGCPSHSAARFSDDRLRHLRGVTEAFRADPDPVKLTIRGFGTRFPHSAP